MKRIFAILLATLCVSGYLEAQQTVRAERMFRAADGHMLPYVAFFPSDFDASRSYPLVLFMHGAGERGTDNKAQLFHGGQMLSSAPELREAIVLAPQCPLEDYWPNIVRPVTLQKDGRKFPADPPVSSSLAAVKELVDSFVAVGLADKEKLYAVGLSMGAMGILDWCCRFPDYFRAVEPICGAVEQSRIEAYRGRTRFRFFHGSQDDIISPDFSRQAYAALVRNGVEAFFVEYPADGHNSWDSAFAEPDFLSWLFLK